MRLELLKAIKNTGQIRAAAKQLGIKNSTAKSIYYKYKHTGKIFKQRSKCDQNEDSKSETDQMIANKVYPPEEISSLIVKGRLNQIS
jgi:hypothetical protein